VIAGIFIAVAAISWFVALMARAARLVNLWLACMALAWLFFGAWVVAFVATH
jgi:hypothetical protein